MYVTADGTMLIRPKGTPERLPNEDPEKGLVRAKIAGLDMSPVRLAALTINRDVSCSVRAYLFEFVSSGEANILYAAENSTLTSRPARKSFIFWPAFTLRKPTKNPLTKGRGFLNHTQV
ncbi:hypothetical protein [Parasulfitobacter algicola]|uniref:Uncharacterized protein n=1 Tax=Parasulfitobacter algicola TaxID=2614809 RepID=A0ABX2ITF3_9RHOB|nr:hypothetical protein [Sulfitobacter algicola]NSX55610.1 hypothetical protein [Sulfitobacter algicola]